MTNKKIDNFCNTKRPLVCLTAYTKYMASIIDPFCDLILVGDSLSMVLYGEKNALKELLKDKLSKSYFVSSYGKHEIYLIN